MAYAGAPRGHETVHQAISDPVVRAWVEQWWDDAARHLSLPAVEVAVYRAELLDRYANPRIRHRLEQIAVDGSQKLPVRILPTVNADLAVGRAPTGAARVLAAWVRHLRDSPNEVVDVAGAEFTALAGGELATAVPLVLGRLGSGDKRLVASVTELVHDLEREAS
jgi:fructuronate reductase